MFLLSQWKNRFHGNLVDKYFFQEISIVRVIYVIIVLISEGKVSTYFFVITALCDIYLSKLLAFELNANDSNENFQMLEKFCSLNHWNVYLFFLNTPLNKKYHFSLKNFHWKCSFLNKSSSGRSSAFHFCCHNHQHFQHEYKKMHNPCQRELEIKIAFLLWQSYDSMAVQKHIKV